VREVLEIDLARNTLFGTERVTSTKWPPRLIQPANLLLHVQSRLAYPKTDNLLISQTHRIVICVCGFWIDALSVYAEVLVRRIRMLPS
jgi:hypothetical protein